MMRAFVLVCLVAAASVFAAPNKASTPTWKLKKCSRTDPKLGECLRDAAHIAIKSLSEKGAKEFGVFPIDPLFISQLTIAQGNGPVSINLQFSDLNIYGLNNATLTDVVKHDVEKLHFEAPVSIPAGITLKGTYEVNGSVLVLPIHGKGNCELNLDNATAAITLSGKLVERDGAVYGDLEVFEFNLDASKLRIQLDNLFDGNKELSAHMNTFLNQNWKQIFDELKPAIQDAFGSAFKEIVGRIFSKVTYDNLFL